MAGHDHQEPRIIIIGAGFSGLCLGVHLKNAGIESFTILEKAERLGGTWRDNSYPGAACDVPSFAYCFSFELKTDWSRKWSPQAEILEYMDHCADKYDLRRHIRLGTEVESARFDTAAGEWTVRTKAGEELKSHFLVSGVGQLNRPIIPEIPGKDSFRGVQFHSARWNHDCDLAGKRVAVIGNAASAIQFIPEVAKQAAHVTVYQRSANWMIPRGDRFYTDAEKERFARHPWLARLYRWWIYLSYEVRFPAFRGNPRFTAKITQQADEYMKEHIADPAMRNALTPDYPFGAKRMLISDDYYPCLTRSNVELVTDRIERIAEDGVVTAAGTLREADVLVFATGFASTQFLSPMRITGRDDRSLNDAWSEGPEAYLGISVAGFPNLFLMYGPNTNLGHNSIIFMIECQTAYIMDALTKVIAADAKLLDLRPDVQRSYNERLQGQLANTVWARVAKSWYKNEAGRITNNWSGTTIEYWWKTRRCDLENYRVESAEAGCCEPASASAAGGQRTAA